MKTLKQIKQEYLASHPSASPWNVTVHRDKDGRVTIYNTSGLPACLPFKKGKQNSGVITTY